MVFPMVFPISIGAKPVSTNSKRVLRRMTSPGPLLATSQRHIPNRCLLVALHLAVNGVNCHENSSGNAGKMKKNTCTK